MSQARHIAFINGNTEVSPDGPLDYKMRETIIGYAWAVNEEKLKLFREKFGEEISHELAEGRKLAYMSEAIEFVRNYGNYGIFATRAKEKTAAEAAEQSSPTLMYGEY